MILRRFHYTFCNNSCHGITNLLPQYVFVALEILQLLSFVVIAYRHGFIFVAIIYHNAIIFMAIAYRHSQIMQLIRILQMTNSGANYVNATDKD